MGFFGFDKNTDTKDLKLSDYENIWTKFCFLDETGTLSDQKDHYFTVGILKMSQLYYLQSRLFFERSKTRFYDEVKFNKLSKNNVTFAKTAIDALFDTRSVGFYSYSIGTGSDYYLKHFNKNPWLAEVSTKKIFNAKRERLALAGVCRFDSKSNDLLQLVDLLIGAVTYDVKLVRGLVDGSKYKIEIVDYLKKKLDTKTFVGGFKSRNFNIFVDKTDGTNNFQKIGRNEKGLSS